MVLRLLDTGPYAKAVLHDSHLQGITNTSSLNNFSFSVFRIKQLALNLVFSQPGYEALATHRYTGVRHVRSVASNVSKC